MTVSYYFPDTTAAVLSRMRKILDPLRGVCYVTHKPMDSSQQGLEGGYNHCFLP